MTELTEAQRVARAEHARRAIEEFIDPAFEAAFDAYGARLRAIASTEPWEAGKITALANAQRILEEVRSQVFAFIADGADAQKQLIRADKIERLTPAKRRLLNIGIP